MIKINPFLVFKPDTANGLVMLNYFTKKYYKLDKKDLDFVFKVFKDVAKGKKIEMTDDIKFLIKNNFLIKENSEEYKLHHDAKIWEEYGNSDSIFYHVFTYNYPFLDYRDDQSMTIDSYMMANYKNKNEVYNSQIVPKTAKIPIHHINKKVFKYEQKKMY